MQVFPQKDALKYTIVFDFAFSLQIIIKSTFPISVLMCIISWFISMQFKLLNFEIENRMICVVPRISKNLHLSHLEESTKINYNFQEATISKKKISLQHLSLNGIKVAQFRSFCPVARRRNHEKAKKGARGRSIVRTTRRGGGFSVKWG